MGRWTSIKEWSEDPFVAALVAALVLAPVLVVMIAAHRAMVLQASAILALTLAVLVRGAIRLPIGDSLRAIPWRAPSTLGVLAYAAAGTVGTLVALLRHNAAFLVAGQSFSMLLIPLAALAGFATGTRRLWRAVSVGLAVALVIKCAYLLEDWARLATSGLPVYRLYSSAGVSVVGHGVLALLLMLPLVAEASRGFRVALLGAAAALLVCIVASGTRSLWVVTPFALVAYLAANGFPPGLLTARRLAIAGAVAAAAVVVVAAGVRLAATPGEPGATQFVGAISFVGGTPGAESELVPNSRSLTNPVISWFPQRTPERFPLSAPIAVERAGWYRFLVWGEATRGCDAYVELEWLDASGHPLGQVRVPLAWEPPGETHQQAGKTPPGTAQARVVAGSRPVEGAIARVQIMELAFPRTGPFLSAMAAQFGYLRYLASTMKPALTLHTGTMDPSASYRLVESRKLAQLFATGTLAEKLFGRGLGATAPINSYGYDNRGNRVLFADPNYIHNFYLFLLFKLGIAGTVLVVGALAALIVDAFRLARRSARGGVRSFAAAAFAAWSAYAVLSLTSPEILDFRVAPTWGLLAASVALAAGDPSAKPRGHNHGREAESNPTIG